MKPYYDSGQVTLYQGDVREVLATLPAESAHMAVTSPPYLGLRDYGIAPTVFGGDPECEHSWEVVTKPNDAGQGRYSGRTRWQHVAEDAQKQGIAVRDVEAGAWTKEELKSDFCSLCGAWRGVLGLESTVDLYVEHIVQVFRAVRRVLRRDGTLWLNIGDSYAGSGQGWGHDGRKQSRNRGSLNQSFTEAKIGFQRPPAYISSIQENGLKPGDMMGVPWRVALALQADGWYLRSAIAWEKPNPMPESVGSWRWEQCRVKIKAAPINRQGDPAESGVRSWSSGGDDIATWVDCPGCKKCAPNDGFVLRRGSWRPTSSYEYIFMFAKSANYYSDGEPIREPISPNWKLGHSPSMPKHGSHVLQTGHRGPEAQAYPIYVEAKGANARDVWRFPAAPFPEAHFATFAPELPKRCILAGTSERGVCPTCGAPWARIVEKSTSFEGGSGKAGRTAAEMNGRGKWAEQQYGENIKLGPVVSSATLGWRPTCGHESEPVPAVVLDPFVGSGTTCVAATALGRRSIGIDLKQKYLDMAVERCRQLSLV